MSRVPRSPRSWGIERRPIPDHNSFMLLLPEAQEFLQRAGVVPNDTIIDDTGPLGTHLRHPDVGQPRLYEGRSALAI